MRGSPPSEDTSLLATKATLMSRYHQPYSEVIKMPIRDVLYFMALVEAEDKKVAKDIEDQKRRNKKW